MTPVSADAGLEAGLTSRCRRLNDRPIRTQGADYVLCWLQQALRGRCNPVIDAALATGNRLGLPVVVYHGLGAEYPHASDRLHTFILQASCSVERDVTARGLRFVRVVQTPEHDAKGTLYRLASRAAALFTDDAAAFVGRWQADTVARKADTAVIAVDAARVVPELAIGTVCRTTPAFRARINDLRDDWLECQEELMADRPAFDGELDARHEPIGDASDLSHLVARCDIDHSLPAVHWCRGDRASALHHLHWAAAEVIPGYAGRRNNAAITGVTWLSPYLHFGVLGPDEVARAAQEVDASRDVWKFLDELIVWREFFHHLAHHAPVPNAYETVPAWARETLQAHAQDPRDALYSLDTLIHGETDDETWNAAQRQFVADGWMHNNLRMYWGKRLIGWTATPELAWRTACYLNDRFSLDGRDPATYGNLRWVFGSGRPAREAPVYGTVSRKSDAAMRRRTGMPAWLHENAHREVPRVSVPDAIVHSTRPQASGGSSASD